MDSSIKRKPGRPRKVVCDPEHLYSSPTPNVSVAEKSMSDGATTGRSKRQLSRDKSELSEPAKRAYRSKGKPEMDPEEYAMYGDLANDEKEYKVVSTESVRKVEATVQKLERALVQRQQQEAEINGVPELGNNTEIIQKFREMIVLKPTGRKFGRLFRQIEAQIFRNNKNFVIRCVDGEDYKTKLHQYGRERIYILDKTDESFGLKVPQINFENLSTNLGEAAEREQSFAISAYKKTHTNATVMKLLEERKKRDDGSKLFDLMNLLSFEVSNEGLSKDIKLPHFVASKSVINRLLEKFEILKTTADPVLLKRLDNIAAGLPKIEKFLLLTMRGSFTDLHIDSSATGVYYHVIEGTKVIFVAEPSEENIAWYSRLEKNKLREQVWVCAQELDKFDRLELKQGQTLMLPLGWLHFVYTPKDSIVVGGNFLEEEYLDLSIRMTKVEEECVRGSIEKVNLFPHFWETLYVFIEFFVNPELLDAVEKNEEVSKKCLDLAKMLDQEMPTTFAGCSWMQKSQMRNHRNMMVSLIKALESQKEARESSTSSSNVPEEDVTKMEDASEAGSYTTGTAINVEDGKSDTDSQSSFNNGLPTVDVAVNENKTGESAEKTDVKIETKEEPTSLTQSLSPVAEEVEDVKKEELVNDEQKVPVVQSPMPVAKPVVVVQKAQETESAEHVVMETAKVSTEATFCAISSSTESTKSTTAGTDSSSNDALKGLQSTETLASNDRIRVEDLQSAE